MLDKEYTKIQLSKDLILETNFSENSKPCKYFKFTLGDKSSIISREELFGILFLFGDEKQQEDLIPITETKVRTITRLLSFKLKKDMRKGEIVKASYTYFMPETLVEKLLLSNPEQYKKGEVLKESELEKHINRIV